MSPSSPMDRQVGSIRKGFPLVVTAILNPTGCFEAALAYTRLISMDFGLSFSSGSGKTYTMGSESSHFESASSHCQGLIPRFLNDLFHQFGQDSSDNSTSHRVPSSTQVRPAIAGDC